METEGNQRQITTNNERNNFTLTENNQTNKKYNKEKHSRGVSMGYDTYNIAQNTNSNTKSYQSSSKYKATFQSIISNVNNIRSYGMSDLQSSTTLQRSVVSISIPKAERFSNDRQ